MAKNSVKVEDMTEEQQTRLKAIQAGWPRWKFPIARAIGAAFKWWVNTVGRGADAFLDWLETRNSPDDLLTIGDVKKAMEDEKAGGLEGEGSSPDQVQQTGEREFLDSQGPVPDQRTFASGALEDPSKPVLEPEVGERGAVVTAAEAKPAPKDGDSFIERNVSPYDGPIRTNSRGTKYLMHHGIAYTVDDIAGIDPQTLDEIYRDTLKADGKASPTQGELIDYIETEFEWAESRPTKQTEVQKEEGSYNPLLD